MSEAERAARRLIARWKDDPCLFSKEVLRTTLWGKQAQVARSVVTNTRTAVKSGHKIGKSTLDACLALWWPLTRARGRTIITAPSGHQITNILWPEVTRLYKQASKHGRPIGGKLSPDPFRGLKLPGERSVICVATDDPVKLAGLSGRNQLFIVDEASGFDERLWDPIFGNLAGGGRVLATGNPTQTSGRFFTAFGEQSHLWSGFTVSSAETPNVVAGRELIEGLALRGYVIDSIEEHAGIKLEPTASLEEIQAVLESTGDDSPFLNIRIKGLFPSQAENTVIGLSSVEAARARWKAENDNSEFLRLGVDVARYGDDDSVVAPRRGKQVDALSSFKGLDGPQLAGAVLNLIAKIRRPGEVPHVNVDVIGVGASCFDALNHLAEEKGITVAAVNVSETSSEPDKYANLRAEMHFVTKFWLLAGGAIPNDGKLHSDLVAPKYKIDEKGRYLIEKKDEIKKRLKRSPDRGEAVMLSIYDPHTAIDSNSDEEFPPAEEESRWGAEHTGSY